MAVNPSTTIMLVDLSIESDRQAEFDHFYHDFYIPEFLQAVPDIRTARRYAQTHLLGDLDPAKAHFLTIYELLSDDSIDSIEAAIARSAHRQASDQFKLWKQNGLTYFDRAFYQQVNKQTHQSEGGCWNSQSLCTWRWSVKPGVATAAAVSYLSSYANQLLNTLPLVRAHHTYLRLDSEQHEFLTVFDVPDEIPLHQLMQAANSLIPHSDNAALRDWLAATMPDHEAMSYNQIYALLSPATSPK
jgi:hypothetical protein